jgi:hypothetical protein
VISEAFTVVPELVYSPMKLPSGGPDDTKRFPKAGVGTPDSVSETAKKTSEARRRAKARHFNVAAAFVAAVCALNLAIFIG